MSHRPVASFLITAMAFWTSACSDPPEPAGKITEVEETSERAPLEPPVLEPEDVEESIEVTSAEATAYVSEPESEFMETLRQLDSALATDDDEAVLDLMFDLEEQGGAESVEGLGIVVDRALDEDLKLYALASLFMLADDEDVSEPLLRAIDDRSAVVRIEALGVIEDMEMVDLIPVLRSKMRRETDPETLEAFEETIEELEYVEDLRRR